MNKIKLVNLLFFISTSSLFAGVMELGVNGSYMSFQNSENSTTITRTGGVSLSYRFLAFSEVELAYANEQTKEMGSNNYFSYSIRTFGDRYSLSWIQNLSGKDSGFQPYFKVGIGYIDRLQRVEINAPTLTIVEDSRGHSATGITGFGLRMFIAKRFAIRGEGTVIWSGIDGKPVRHYLYSAGLSWFF